MTNHSDLVRRLRRKQKFFDHFIPERNEVGLLLEEAANALEAASRFPTDVTLNRMAQRFYEVASADGELSVRRMAGGKECIVNGLRAAIIYQREIEGPNANK